MIKSIRKSKRYMHFTTTFGYILYMNIPIHPLITSFFLEKKANDRSLYFVTLVNMQKCLILSFRQKKKTKSYVRFSLIDDIRVEIN